MYILEGHKYWVKAAHKIDLVEVIFPSLNHYGSKVKLQKKIYEKGKN